MADGAHFLCGDHGAILSDFSLDNVIRFIDG
jgi:hypothetical protein